MNLAQRYEAYSLEDLRDVERHIDRKKFPERYTALMEEIARREAGAPQVLGALPKPEALWHATVREIYGAVFAITIAMSMICGLIFGLAVPVAHAFVAVHAAPAATATQTVPVTTGQGRDRRTVYITPGESARLQRLAQLATYGLSTVAPIVLVVGFVVHGLGIRIFDPPKKDTAPPNCAGSPGAA